MGELFGAENYARTVRNKSILRQTMLACRKLYAECEQNGNSKDVLERGEKMLRDLSASMRTGSAAEDCRRGDRRSWRNRSCSWPARKPAYLSRGPR
jgi:hypothetical protein